MRVARGVRGFFDWRWAPCLALIAGSLAFVALALLLIPAQFAGAPPIESAPDVFERPSIQAHGALLGALHEQEASRTTERRPKSVLAPALQPPLTPRVEPDSVPAISEPPAATVAPPDFVANIADRGDRPQRRALSP